MNDIKNNLHITPESDENLGNDSDKNEDLFKTFQHLPENPGEIMKQAAELEEHQLQEKMERWEIDDKYLLSKPNMTKKDKEWMETALASLATNSIDIPENRKKLYAINYTKDYIEIGWIKFSREKFVPQVTYTTENEYGVMESSVKGIYKYNDKGQEEVYLTVGQYNTHANKQWRIAITDIHIQQALQALPGDSRSTDFYNWGNTLGDILWLSMSGYVTVAGELKSLSNCGYLNCVPPINQIRAFGFYDTQGGFRNNADNLAFPCLYLLE